MAATSLNLRMSGMTVAPAPYHAHPIERIFKRVVHCAFTVCLRKGNVPIPLAPVESAFKPRYRLMFISFPQGKAMDNERCPFFGSTRHGPNIVVR